MSDHAELAQTVVAAAGRAGLLLATAESCTGGLVAGALTGIAGSSAAVDRGFVTYSNEAKHEMLGVDAALIDKVGAVSREVAEAMAMGAILNSHADVAVAITGIAGPSGGSPEKPVGLVWFGLSYRGITVSERALFQGDRAAIRGQAVEKALTLLLEGVRRLG